MKREIIKILQSNDLLIRNGHYNRVAVEIISLFKQMLRDTCQELLEAEAEEGV